MRRWAAAAAAGIILIVAAGLVARALRDDAKLTLPAGVPTPAPGTYARPLGVAVRLDASRSDAVYARGWLEHYTSVTPENELKWEIVEPREGEFDFAKADAIVRAARRAGKRVRGHTLTWDIQLPGWLTSRTWSAREMEDILRTHVRRVVGHFRGRIAQWDVVNEPLDTDGSLTRSVFAQALGERFVDIAFDAAHRADPRARLFLNEIASELPSAKQDALVALARRLVARGVPIDGVGLQDHTTADAAPTQAILSRDIARFARLGLDVEFTELDVGVRPGMPLDAAHLAAQARGYAAAAAACRAARACTGVTVWGVDDKWSWLGPQWRATPYAADGTPKPAAAALRRALRP